MLECPFDRALKPVPKFLIPIPYFLIPDTYSPKQKQPPGRAAVQILSIEPYLPNAACAAARRATGTRNGEQLT